MIRGLRHQSLEGLERLRGGAGDQQRPAPGHDPAGYFRYLFRCLAQAQNHLREPLPQLAMVVDPGKAQVLEGGLH